VEGDPSHFRHEHHPRHQQELAEAAHVDAARRVRRKVDAAVPQQLDAVQGVHVLRNVELPAAGARVSGPALKAWRGRT